MTDENQTQAPPAPPANVPPPPAPDASAAPAIDLKALAAELAPLLAGGQAQAPASAPEAPAKPTSPTNLFEKGQVVSYTYTTPYDGEVTRHGIVIDTFPDEGAGARSAVAWFDHVSGPLGDELLEAG